VAGAALDLDLAPRSRSLIYKTARSRRGSRRVVLPPCWRSAWVRVEGRALIFAVKNVRPALRRTPIRVRAKERACGSPPARLRPRRRRRRRRTAS